MLSVDPALKVKLEKLFILVPLVSTNGVSVRNITKQESNSLGFLSGGGQMGALMRSHDWSATSLGPAEHWPQALRTVVRLMLNTGHPVYIFWGQDSICLYNDAYSESIGPERHPVSLGEPGYAVWEEIWPVIGPQIKQALAGENASWHVNQLLPITRHGQLEEVYWTYSYSPIDDETAPGGIGGVLVLCTETTEQVVATRALAQEGVKLAESKSQLEVERAQLMAVFQQAPAFMCILRGPGHAFEVVNERYLQLIGWRETTGKTVREAVPELIEQGYIDLLDNVYATGKSSVGTGARVVLQHTVDGPTLEHFVDFVFVPLRDGNNQVNGILVHGIDVTERKRAEDELRRERDRSQAVFDTMTEGFTMLDRDWIVLYLNAEGLRLSNRTEQQTIGHKHWEIWPELLGTDMERMLRRVMRSRSPEVMEFAYLYPNGSSAWIEVRASPAMDGGLAVFFRDVTNRRQAEEKLRDADRRKDEFLAMLAHELRNPLAPIGAAAELLQMVKLDEARVRQTSQIIGRQVEHMTGLVNDLLDVSRVTSGKVELESVALDISHILTDAVEQVRPLVGARKHRLMLDLPADVFLVKGDKKRLVQVVANLLANAAKYTPEGGTILLKTAMRDDRIHIEVSDNGIGMDTELVARAFDLFAQAERTSDRSSGGLGLGLALVKSLVELHSGTVTCASEGRGKGSTFTVCLPRLLERPDQVDHSRDGEALKPTHQPLRVMVVDDNVDAAAMLGMLLEAAGHEVLVEHSAYRALERAKAARPQVCLIDIGLPELDGNQVAQRLRSWPETADTVLIAVTGYGQESDRESALAAGFNHHLVKPVDTRQLAAILNKIAAP
jgi:PAS domain S-box-containing protein